ncbi:MAG: pitrilysin family protein [Candidatus Peregrinibacteria bacterium]
MYTVSSLSSGLRVLTAPGDGTAAVTVHVFTGAGSRYERRNERGISHFLEHMFFKGGKKYRSTRDVSMAIDSVGGDFNAFTGKEYAGYYVKVAAESVPLACDVLSDMLLHASFPATDIERERGVIMEEERMYQDTPMYRAGWDFEELLFGDHPLGWDTIGTEKVIRSVTQKDFSAYKHLLYTPDNLVLVFAGKIAEREAMHLAKEYFSPLSGKKKRVFEPFLKFEQKKLFLRTKATEQAHLVLGVPAVSALDPDHFAHKLLAIILGGNMSSRMFLNIREAKGLCYYISTETDSYLDAGVLSTRAGVDQSRLSEAIADIVREYKICAAKGISEDELVRAKSFLKGKMTLGLEDSEEQAHFYGKQLLLYPEVRDTQQYFAEIDRVTRSQVNALAKKILVPEKLHLVVIGKEDDSEKLGKLMK